MRVLIFNTLYYPNFIGGAEKSVQALAEGLVKEGNKVSVITTTPDKDHSKEVNNVKVYYLNTNNIYWGFDGTTHSGIKKIVWHTIDSLNLSIDKKIKEIIDLEKPDIIHTNNISGFSVVIWEIIKKRNYKIIHTLRDYYLLCPKTTMYKNNNNCKEQCLTCKIYSIPKKINSNKIDAVVGISKYILKKHIQKGYFSNVKMNTVIENDVGDSIKNTKIFNPEMIKFGFIGQLTESKGISYLLSIFNKMQHLNNWELLIAGKGDDKIVENLKLNYQDKRYKFLGIVNSKEFYNKIDVLIVPSLWQEPFGRVVLEGIKNGKHVLATNKGGIPELLESKFLFDPETKELEYKILDILKSSNVSNSPLPQTSNITKKYLDLYNTIIKK